MDVAFERDHAIGATGNEDRQTGTFLLDLLTNARTCSELLTFGITRLGYITPVCGLYLNKFQTGRWLEYVKQASDKESLHGILE